MFSSDTCVSMFFLQPSQTMQTLDCTTLKHVRIVFTTSFRSALINCTIDSVLDCTRTGDLQLQKHVQQFDVLAKRKQWHASLRSGCWNGDLSLELCLGKDDTFHNRNFL